MAHQKYTDGRQRGKKQNKIMKQNIQYQFLNAEQISENRFVRLFFSLGSRTNELSQ